MQIACPQCNANYNVDEARIRSYRSSPRIPIRRAASPAASTRPVFSPGRPSHRSRLGKSAAGTRPPAHASPKLLDEDSAGVRDSCEAEDIHVRDIDSLVEDVNSRQDGHLAGAESEQAVLPFPLGEPRVDSEGT